MNKIEQWFDIRHFGEPQKKAGAWALVFFSSLRSSARLRSIPGRPFTRETLGDLLRDSFNSPK